MTRKFSRVAVCAVVFTALGRSIAVAAGNAHVIDDSAVEAPGSCHLEAWTTRLGERDGVADLAPACTRVDWPALELGAAVQRTWTAASSDLLAGPALKLNIIPDERGAGVAVSTSAAYSVRKGRLEAADIIAPLTLPVGERLRINLNAGWSFLRSAPLRNAAFYGAQAELSLPCDLALMTEAFRRDGGRVGQQIGLRWTPHDGDLDLDVVAGRRIDGASPRAISVGFTKRR